MRVEALEKKLAGVVIADADTLSKVILENAMLKTALKRYGNHEHDCDIYYTGGAECSCGFNKIFD